MRWSIWPGSRSRRGSDLPSTTRATLDPGGRIILVADRDAFEAAHGAGHAVAGTYSGRLANERRTTHPGRGRRLERYPEFPLQRPRTLAGRGRRRRLQSRSSSRRKRLRITSCPKTGAPVSTMAGAPGIATPRHSLESQAAGCSSTPLGDPTPPTSNSSMVSPCSNSHSRIGADDVEFSIEVSRDLKVWRPGRDQLPRTIRTQWRHRVPRAGRSRPSPLASSSLG